MHQSNLEPRMNIQMSPEDESGNDPKIFLRSSNPNSGVRSHTNISKRGGVSFNLGRVIPRNISQDKESLYAENLRLRQQNKELRDGNVKLKTRLNVSEKQKQHIFQNLSYPESGVLRSGSRSLPRGQKIGSSNSMQKQNVMKKILRETRQQAQKVKKQNNQIKKTLKYTQLSQINIQNQRLAQQCSRLQHILSSGALIQNAEEIEAEIHNLRADLKLEKQSTKTLMMQMKRKDQQMQKVKDMTAEDQDKIKRLNKQIYLLRNDKKSGKGGAISPLTTEQRSKIANLSSNSITIESCQKCKILSKELEDAKKEIIQLNKRLREKQLSSAQSGVRFPQKSGKKFEKMGESEEEEQRPSMKKKQKKIEQKKSPSTKKKTEVKESEEQFDEYNEEFEEQIPQKQQKSLKKSPQNPVKDKKKTQNSLNQKKKTEQKKINSSVIDDQYEIDQFEEDLEEKQEKVDEKKKNISQKENKKQEIVEDEYDEGFDDDEIKQEPEETKAKAAETSNYTSQVILKQTITNKFMTQRYQYSDLIEDLSNSGMKELKVEDLANILNNQPFFLTEDQIQLVLQYVLGKEQNDSIDLNHSVKTSVFTKKIKYFIGDFTLLPEQKEQKIEEDIKLKVTKNKQKLLKEFSAKKKSKKQEATKEEFIAVFTSNNFSKQQIAIALAQSMLVSTDILHINYPAYIKGISQEIK